MAEYQPAANSADKSSAVFLSLPRLRAPHLLSIFTGRKYALSPQRNLGAQHQWLSKIKPKFETSRSFQILPSNPLGVMN